MIKEREMVLKKWRIAEHLSSLKTPVMEAEFAIDERSALSLYDCIVPRLKEHRRLAYNKEVPLSINDIMAQ